MLCKVRVCTDVSMRVCTDLSKKTGLIPNSRPRQVGSKPVTTILLLCTIHHSPISYSAASPPPCSTFHPPPPTCTHTPLPLAPPFVTSISAPLPPASWALRKSPVLLYALQPSPAPLPTSSSSSRAPLKIPTTVFKYRPPPPPPRPPLSSTQYFNTGWRPVFPGSSRLGIEPKTPGWLVQTQPPAHRGI
jgi:hypothetical protein